MANAAIYPSLVGRKVIVSGGATGIGEGIVEAFVRQGSAVAFVDVLDDAGDALVKRFADAAIAPVFVNCDIRDCADYGAKIEKLIGRLGGCDVLINNAANDDRHSIEEITSEYWDERMAVNLKHQFFAAKAVVPAMKAAGGGAIVNLGSISWHLGLEDLTVYQVAKACDQGKTTRYDAAGAILLASENAVKVANEAVQALGGAGYTKDWPVERYYRDAKLLDIGAGTNEIRRMLIGRELIGV